MKRYLLKILVVVLFFFISGILGCSSGNKFSGSNDVKNPTIAPVTPPPTPDLPANPANPETPDTPETQDPPTVKEPDHDWRMESYTTCVSYIATKDTTANSQMIMQLYANGDQSPTIQMDWSNNYTEANARSVKGHSGTKYTIHKASKNNKDPKSGFTTSSKSIPATKVISSTCQGEDECILFDMSIVSDSETLYGGAANCAYIGKYTLVSGGKKYISYAYGHRIHNTMSSVDTNHIMDQDPVSSEEELHFDDFCFPIGHLDKIEHKTN